MIMDEFMECEVEEHLEMGNEGILFRMAAIPGEDTNSLFAIDAMNKVQQAQFWYSLMSSNMTIWESREWNCLNADTDGGEPAVRAVAISWRS